MAQKYTGGCQCGRVRFEVQLELGEVIACNCSRCGRLGSLLAFAPRSDFRLLTEESALTGYEFNKHLIHHTFCSTCGIQSFAIGKNPRTGAEMAAINVRCVDGIELEQLPVRKVDGRNL
jgi:hypothetical protein